MAATVRVQGVTYTSPDEARVAADEIEYKADELAGDLRDRGRDAEADQVQDRGHANAEKLRAWAREHDERQAAATAQPEDTPKEPPAAPRKKPSSAKGSGSGGRRRSGGSSSRRSGFFTGRQRTRTVYQRSGLQAQATSAGSLLWQLLGLTISAALLTLFLTDKGASAFGGLATGLAGALKLIVDPVDPLAPGSLRSALGAPAVAATPVLNTIPGAGGRLMRPMPRRGGLPLRGAVAV